MQMVNMGLCGSEWERSGPLQLRSLQVLQLSMNHHLHDDDLNILVTDIQDVKLHIYSMILLGFSHNSSISLLSDLSSLSD
jgi:hypothetical protein